MNLFTSALLASLLLTFATVLPTAQAQTSSQDTLNWQTHLVQKRGQPKHRGSGRRELVSFTELFVS
ncbi:MAG: hypothetical protein NW220_10585 [Leptolyngbyaceae cyanobacterium bins.349]|nr:hypothetical protein [Leptolyngbyaceae cyanobacterium bins.349]